MGGAIKKIYIKQKNTYTNTQTLVKIINVLVYLALCGNKLRIPRVTTAFHPLGVVGRD